MKKFSFLVVTLLLLTQVSYSTIYTVTSTSGNDWWPACGGAGSLMEALCNASAKAGRDTIRFAINGGTTISAAKTPIVVSDNGGLLIDGISTLNGTSVIISGNMQITGNDVTTKSVIFTIASGTLGLEITGTRDTISNCTINKRITISSNANVIDNLTSTVSDDHSIYVTGNNNKILNSTITNNGTTDNHCVNLFSGTSNQVTNCTIKGNGHGITVAAGSSSNTITGCTISQSGSTNPSNIGIVIRGAGSNTVTNCTVDDVNHNGIGLLDNTTNNTISNCTFKNNLWAGIAFGDSDAAWPELPSTSNTVTNCTVNNNGSHGILIGGGSTSNKIEKTKVYNNNTVDGASAGANDYKFAGIYIKGNSTTIDSCYVYGNRANGILVDNNAGSSLGTNSIIKNTLVGISNNNVVSGNGWNGIFVRYVPSVTVENSVIVDNGTNPNSPAKISGIRYQEVNGGTIQNNYIGTNASKINAGNDFDGITLHTNVSNITVSGNTICNNGLASTYGAGGGIANRNNSDNNIFRGNFIGVHQDLTDGGNYDYGISLEDNCGGNTIGGALLSQGNVIANAKNAGGIGAGIWIVTSSADNNVAYNNVIRNNVNFGVLIERGASGNIIGASGQGNSITGNAYGITVRNNGTTNTNNNTLRYNSFSCNTSEGINITDTGNDNYGISGGLKTVTVNTTEVRANYVSGYAPSASATVDIYASDNNCSVACDNIAYQGMTYVTTVTASATNDGNGYMWEYDFVAGGNLVGKSDVVVLATQSGAAGSVNTSEFSRCLAYITCDAPTNAALSANKTSFCQGDSATLTATANNMDAGDDYRYIFYKGAIHVDSIVASQLNDATLNVLAAGTYMVTIANTINESTCIDTSNNVVITVNQYPTITITPSANVLCVSPGTTVTLTGSPATGTWSGQAAGATLTTSVGGTFTYSVTENGCTDSENYTLASENKPVVTLNDDTLCSGIAISLDGSGGVVNETYSWNSGQTSQTISVNSAGTYIVTTTGPLGCQDKDTAVITGPTVPTISANKPVLCLFSGNTVDLTFSPSGSEITSFDWVGQADNNPLSVNSAGTYTVNVLFDNGCTETANYTLSDEALPNANIENATICSGEAVTVNASTGSAGETYLWQDGSTAYSLTTSSAGLVWVEITSANNCVKRDSAIVYAAVSPTVYVGEDTTICAAKFESYKVVLTHNGLAGGTFSWSTGATGTDNILVTTTPSTVTGTYTDINGCSGSDVIVISEYCYIPPDSLPNVTTKNSPFTPVGDLTPEDVKDGTSKLEVYDRWGLKMYQTTDDIPTWDLKYNGNDVASGVYFWIWIYEDVANVKHNENGYVHVINK